MYVYYSNTKSVLVSGCKLVYVYPCRPCLRVTSTTSPDLGQVVAEGCSSLFAGRPLSTSWVPSPAADGPQGNFYGRH